ncbi:MAG: phage baseplate assembly protein V [Roseibium sp.]|nr:phage baseplate assembly protein V [Roseibium sp.]
MSELDLAVSKLIRRIEAIEERQVETERQTNNIVREAVVTEVFEDGTAIVDAADLKTKRIPWLTLAGAVNDWNPPTVGERVVLLSPSGDPAKAMILPGGYTHDNPQPHSALGESMRKVGETTIKTTGEAHEVIAGKIILKGAITIEGPVEIVGDKVTHNGTNISDDHVHGGVMRGSSDTDGPH